MDFHLRYRGPLPTNGRPKDKAAIREQLSPQLGELFKTARQLRDVRLDQMPTAASFKGGKVELNPDNGKGSELSYKFLIGDYTFVPLVTCLHGLICEIDITFLRREEPGEIVKSGGDLDNRLKTFFDALRMPHYEHELGLPKVTTEPSTVFCLVEDDALITRLGLVTGRLLGDLHANGCGEKQGDVELQMHVIIKVNRGMIGNLDFL
jgi:hypothetical protein